MANTKSFFASKINWTAIVLILIQIQTLISEQTLWDTKAVTILILGVLIVIFRTYFTTTEIKQPSNS